MQQLPVRPFAAPSAVASTHGHRARVVISIVLLALTLALAGCSFGQPATSPSAEATISALATSNAALATQVAGLSAALGTPTPPAPAEAAPAAAAPAAAAPAAAAPAETAPAETAPAAPAVTDAPAAPAAAPTAAATLPAAPQVSSPGDGPLPFLVAAVSLAPTQQTLVDLRLDRSTNQLFVTDSANQLHVLDATTYAPKAVLPYGGRLTLDAEHGRLFVARQYVTEGEENAVYVLDTTSLAEIGKLAGRSVTVDAANNRLFVGEPYTYSANEAAPGVRVYAGATLQQTGQFTQTGVPVYNPARNELLIDAYTVYTADPNTLTVTGDLFPALTDLGEGGFLWCNGCTWVDDVQYVADQKLVLVAAQPHCAGKGCGTVEPPRLLDATTLEPVATTVAPRREDTCGSAATLTGAVAGRRYVDRVYDRYVTFTNLDITDDQGQPLTHRDGLRIDFVNPRTNQGYLYDGTVLDLATLLPVGTWPASCIFTAEADTGLIFSGRGGDLYVIAEQGSQPTTPAAPSAEALPGGQSVRQVAVSPDFADDTTLLASLGGGLFRSTDGGVTWMKLHGGLPESTDGQWVAAFSPDFANDRTIFAGGERREFWGEGVWRSTDAGDTWQPMWGDLVHRRITELDLSPDFAQNQTLVAQAAFFDVATGRAGDSYQQSTDAGLTWTLVVTGNVATADGTIPLPPVSELLPGYQPEPALPVRIGGYGEVLQVTPDGSNWVTATVTLKPADQFRVLLPAPGYPDDPTIYAVAGQGIWRTADNGATWAAWEDSRLAQMDATAAIMTAVVVPAQGGADRLVAGTADGQVWVLDPAQMAWGTAQPAIVAVATPVATPAPVTMPAASAASAVTETATTTTSIPATATVAATVTTATAMTATGTTTETTPAAAAPGAGVATPGPVLTGTATLTTTPADREPVAGGLTGEPPAGLFAPQGALAAMWERNANVQQDLGWARQAQPTATNAAVQRFDNGTMVWREDTGQIYVFFSDGTWQSFSDTFEEGQAESDPKYAAPQGKLQPIRGFGKVWREHESVREKIGWALAKEQAQQAQVHPFEKGALLSVGGLLLTVVGVDTDRGRWY